jgi:hypothetical protein
MVRREQGETIKNRLEKSGAVPKWEAGDADGLRKPCIFIGENERSENSTYLQKRDKHREGSVGNFTPLRWALRRASAGSHRCGGFVHRRSLAFLQCAHSRDLRGRRGR